MSEKELDTELEDENELVELVDEEGKIVNCKLLDVTEYKGVKYALLLAAEPNEDIDEDEVMIFVYNEEAGTLDTIEDENLLNEVFDFYIKETEGEADLDDNGLEN